MITNRQPNLWSFIQQSKSVVLCAITALLKLVSQEESAKPTSLAKDFDIILEGDNATKCFSLYKERRLTKLHYTTGSIIDCVSQFQKLLYETKYNDNLVQACHLYLENDYIPAVLKALSYFTYKVTMPYQNCVEKCNQNDSTEYYQDSREIWSMGHWRHFKATKLNGHMFKLTNILHHQNLTNTCCVKCASKLQKVWKCSLDKSISLKYSGTKSNTIV